MSDDQALREAIRRILRARKAKSLDECGPDRYRHAGVLIPLLQEEDGCKVLFTLRTRRVEHHKGQISFPGGGVEEGDASVEETALRETREEIGLSHKDIEVLGRIDDAFTMVSNYIIHPVVGWISSIDDLAVNPAEVTRIITAPLTFFHPHASQNKRYSVVYEGVAYETPAFEYGEHTIWGATARMMENFMEIVGDKLCLPPDRK